jgi:hypothetical protein
MRGSTRLVARAVVSAGLAVCSLVAVAHPALAGTITAQACTDTGGTIVKHGGWLGCHYVGQVGSDIKIVG